MYSPVEFQRCFEERTASMFSKQQAANTAVLHSGLLAVCILLVSCLTYTSILKMEAVRSSKTCGMLPYYKALYPTR